MEGRLIIVNFDELLKCCVFIVLMYFFKIDIIIDGYSFNINIYVVWILEWCYFLILFYFFYGFIVL